MSEAPKSTGAGGIHRHPLLWIAGVVMAVVVAAVLFRPTGERHGTVHSPAPNADVRPGVRALVPENVPMERDAFVLRWTPGKEGCSYDLQVLHPDMTVLTRIDGLTAPQYHVGQLELASVPSGTTLLWQVDVVSPDGDRETSSTFRATVR